MKILTFVDQFSGITQSRIRLLVAGVLILLLCKPQPLSAALPDHLPVIRIQAQGLTPLQTGLETGRQVKAQFPDIEQRYDAWLATLFSRSELDIILRQQLPVLVKQLDESSRAELQGISGAWSLSAVNKAGDGQLSLDEYHLLNLLPDLGLLPNGIGFGIYGTTSVDGNPVVGRNLDWAGNAELQNLQVITVYENEQHSFVTIGFAGMITLFSGFNDQGLFISLLNAAPYSPYNNHNRLKNILPPYSFEWRKALTSQSTVTGAIRYLDAQKYAVAHSVLIADKKIIQVLEYSPQTSQGYVRRWNSQIHSGKTWEHPNQIAAVNCLMLAGMPDTCGLPGNTVRWERLNKLAALSDPKHPADPQTVAQILFDQANRSYELFNTNTLQSLYYSPVSGSLHLYAQTNGSAHPVSPLHQPYLDLLSPAEEWKIPLTW
ncbi:MAG: Unknown protein, partial [uncultured Thiotrichaceae bacterium]